MKVSIRTAYRIVKKTEDKDDDPIFIPQYQDEETGEQWHSFRIPIRGRGGGYNTVYFYVLSKAIDYLTHQKTIEDAVVLQTPKKPSYNPATNSPIKANMYKNQR